MSRPCRLDMLANTFMRAPGEAVGTFALECAIDELADELGIDPIELRIRNEPEKDPTDRPAVLVARHCARPGATGAERFGWDKRSATPGARREGEWLIGMGCATGDLSLLPHARRRGAHHADRGTATRASRSPRTRWAWAPPRPRRRSPPSGSACRWSR